MFFIGWEMQYYKKAATMGNWWLAASSRQCVRSWITVLCRAFLQNIKPPRWLSAPYSPDLAPCNFWLFPRLKSPLKGKRFQTISEIQEDMMRQMVALGRTVWGLKVPTLMGMEASLFCVQCFLYLASSPINKCLHFSQCMAGYFLDRPSYNICTDINLINRQADRWMVTHTHKRDTL